MREDYSLTTGAGMLTMRTGSFSAERDSMLHSGIFNREMVSSLAAGGVLTAMLMLALLAGLDVTAIYTLPGLALFAGFFLVFRKYAFYEPILEVTMDTHAGTVSVMTVNKPLARARVHPFTELAGVVEGKVIHDQKNPDGADFVEKIALQHGTVIPGFGEEKELNTVGLRFRDGLEITVFATEDVGASQALALKLRDFIGDAIAQAD